MLNGNFGYYNAEGQEASVYLFDFPEMCKTCALCYEEEETVQCHITRLLQLGNENFSCANHLKKESVDS